MPTVTSTHWAADASGGTTLMEVAVCDTMRPPPAVPNVTEVALPNPPPKMVMAPPPVTGPRVGAHGGDRGEPSPALQRDGQVLVDGRPQPAGRVEAGGGGEEAAVGVGEVVVALGDVGEGGAVGLARP